MLSCISLYTTDNNQHKMICLPRIMEPKHGHSTSEVLFHIKSFMVKGNGISRNILIENHTYHPLDGQ